MIIPVVVAAVLAASAETSQASVAPIYTYPFNGTIAYFCGWGCYPSHQGSDFFIAPQFSGGQDVVAAAKGTAKPCAFSTSAGYFPVMDHGNGHRTRYLHPQSAAYPSDGQIVERGQLVGKEGDTGDADGYHLHFETRHGATTFSCPFGGDGTNVNPYDSQSFMWSTNPPSYSQGTETAGVFRDSNPPRYWYFSNTHDGTTHLDFAYGQAGDLPVAGAWQEGGSDGIGVVRCRGTTPPCADKNWKLRYTASGGPAQLEFAYGQTGDTPVVGDWNGDGVVTPGHHTPLQRPAAMAPEQQQQRR
jgi:hypothetical protein